MKVKFNQFKTKSTQSSDSKGSNSMKKNRKLTALLVAACMTLPMAATTFTVPMVASAGSIKINNATSYNDDANNMKAYQVFTGNYSAGILSITGWGADFNAVGFIGFLQGDAIFSGAFDGIAVEETEATAQQVATEIAKYNNDANKTKAEAVARYAVQCKGSNPSGTPSLSGTTLTITDLDDGYYVIVDSSAGTDEALTLGLLQVGSDDELTVTPKRVVPTVTKKAKDSKDGADYDSVVDCYKGEIVKFKVEVAVPDLSRYNDYYLEIIDTLGTDFESPSGVTLKDGSGNPITDDANCDITTESNQITIKIENAIDYSGQTLSLEYSATLKATATTGNEAFTDETQINKVFVKYLNDPNNAWKPTNGSAVETPAPGLLSSTTEAEVRAYTYKITIDKIEKDNTVKKLEGAKFVLKDSNDSNAKYVQKIDEADGIYKIEWVTNKNQASEFETNSSGAVSIVGLDAGTYYLEETVAPSGGYNRLTDSIAVTITPTYDGTSKTLTNLSGTVGGEVATADKAKGEITVQVANNKGATLPSTGGIGTKIFYILGGTLVIGSGAALVIKKRMSKDEE